jgi:hypothetical protein
MSTHRFLAAATRGDSLPSRGVVFRRRADRARTTEPAIGWHDAVHHAPVQQVLRNTLQSACELVGAERAFVLVLRQETTFEVACTRRILPREILDTMFGHAARALHRTLTRSETGLCDQAGNPLWPQRGDALSPAVVSLPLDLGLRQRGTLCLLRACVQQALHRIDFEILDALAAQAALALAAANQQRALHRLEASLGTARQQG